MTDMISPELFASVPDPEGRFGPYGGKFAAETLMSALADRGPIPGNGYGRRLPAQFDSDLAHYVGRPSPLYEASRMSMRSEARIFLKREDLNHTGAHKVNMRLARRCWPST